MRLFRDVIRRHGRPFLWILWRRGGAATLLPPKQFLARFKALCCLCPPRTTNLIVLSEVDEAMFMRFSFEL